MSEAIKNFMKKKELEKRLENVSIGYLAPIVNETVQMAKKKYSMTCGTLEPPLLSKEYARLVKEKSIDGVEFIIISDKTATFKESKQKACPLLFLLDNSHATDVRVFENISFFYKTNGQPILHYIAVDDKFALVEACHGECDRLRNVSLFKDKKVIKALDSKSHYDIGMVNVIQAGASSDYLDYHLRSSKEIGSRGAEIEFAKADPFGWINNAVQKEIRDYETREANFRKLAEGHGEKMKRIYGTKLLRKLRAGLVEK